MKLIRKPLPQEEQLLETLIELTNLKFDENWKTNLLVAPMGDGGMGSLRLYPKGILDTHVSFGKQVSDYQFFDEDNVPVWGLYNGKSLTGTDGIFAPMLKHFLESALQGELENHLSESKANQVEIAKMVLPISESKAMLVEF